jgi:hypothetical protein
MPPSGLVRLGRRQRLLIKRSLLPVLTVDPPATVHGPKLAATVGLIAEGAASGYSSRGVLCPF